MDWYAAICQRVLDRQARYKHNREVDMIFPPAVYGERCIVGGGSAVLLESSERHILSDKTILTDAGKETYSALARDYLAAKYKKSPGIMHRQRILIDENIRAIPAFSKPCTFEHGYYLDLSSAFWNVLNRVGWNLDYWPGRWLGYGDPCFDFPFSRSKPARICLVSCAISTVVEVYDPKRPKTKKPIMWPNRLVNHQLWRAVCDVLLCIANDMVRSGAVYVMTDGYIFRDYKAMTHGIDALAQWGLPFGIKAEGPGAVFGRGDYYFNKPRRPRGPVHDFDNLTPPLPYAAMLRRTIVRSPNKPPLDTP